jgi:hypothetical protein
MDIEPARKPRRKPRRNSPKRNNPRHLVPEDPNPLDVQDSISSIP